MYPLYYPLRGLAQSIYLRSILISVLINPLPLSYQDLVHPISKLLLVLLVSVTRSCIVAIQMRLAPIKIRVISQELWLKAEKKALHQNPNVLYTGESENTAIN